MFLTAAAILLFYDTLFGSRSAVAFAGKLFTTLSPVFYGALFAYLLAPVVDFWERHFFRKQVTEAKSQGKFCAHGPRAVSLLLTWLLIGAGLWLLMNLLIPELYRSVVQLVNSLGLYYNTIVGWVSHLLEQFPELESWVTATFADYFTGLNKNLIDFLTTKVIPQAQQITFLVSGGIWKVVVLAGDLVVGVIVSMYLLAAKERCAAHCRKLVYGFVPAAGTDWVFRGAEKVDSIFAGFVRGKLLDSLIIGVICFVVCQFLSMPYTPLVSVIVGVTNIIPFFGPFLGAIPSLFLILLVSPLKALYFLLFIICLQQLDGNVIGPRILGDKTGLSGLWVIVAILVGGSFFGVVGMFFGVPVFACLYSFVSFMTRMALKKRGLPEATAVYRSSLSREKAEDAPAEKP